MLKIVLGTESKLKRAALEQALSRYQTNADIVTVQTSTGLNEQPVGMEETYAGAFYRAQQAKAAYRDRMAIGIESGIVQLSTETWIDLAVVVVLFPSSQCIVVTSEGIGFPAEFVEIARKRGFGTNTVGSVIAERLGGAKDDPHCVLTNGKIMRQMVIANAITTALSRRHKPRFF